MALLTQQELTAFCRGEDAGVRAAYQHYSGPVYAVAVSVLHDRDLANDVVQETFLRAWRAAARFDPSREFGPWIFTIARRVAVDAWRARLKAADPIEDDAVVALPTEIDQVWEAFQVRSAVGRLPEDEREIVGLQHFGQLTHHEIADRLGIPLGTVKSRSHRAHRRLAEWLGPLLGEPEEASATYSDQRRPGAQPDE